MLQRNLSPWSRFVVPYRAKLSSSLLQENQMHRPVVHCVYHTQSYVSPPKILPARHQSTISTAHEQIFPKVQNGINIYFARFMSSSASFSSSASSTTTSLENTASTSPALIPNTTLQKNQKSLFKRLWDEYSPSHQRRRIILAERLFSAAQFQANIPLWFRHGQVPLEFRPRHALLTMHIWFLHRRLIADPIDPHSSLLVQEELFNIFWNDTRARIRAEKVNELSVNKQLNQVQQYTFAHLTHYDHAFSKYGNDVQKRMEEVAAAIWIHVFQQKQDIPDEIVRRIAYYVEYQLENIVFHLPDQYFQQGQIGWGNLPDFPQIVSPSVLVEQTEKYKDEFNLPPHWVRLISNAGKYYYWNTLTQKTQWERPSFE